MALLSIVSAAALHHAAAAKSLQSCPTLCDPRDGCPPGSPVHNSGQIQLLRLLFSCSVVSDSFMTPWTVAYQAPLSVGFPSKNTGVGCHFLLQEIFPTQGSNSHLLHCWHLPLSHKGSLCKFVTDLSNKHSNNSHL